MNETLKVLETRRSCRNFDSEKSVSMEDLVLAAMMLSVSCSRKDTAPSVKCYNGTFVGMTENGITSFKGIPYAKPPIGELRWKAPEPVEADDGTYDATHFGKSAIQLKASSELASMNP